MPAIRVLIVDDSVVVRRLLTEVLSNEADIEVAGSAADGTSGLNKIALLRPDLVTLDIEMPGMTGLETVVEIRKLYPKLPVIMFSTLTERGGSFTLEALALGASDYVTKPSNTGSLEQTRARIREELVPKVRALCKKRTTLGIVDAMRATALGASAQATPKRGVPGRGRVDVVAIGASTGGPNALAAVLPLLQKDFPVPVVVVVSYADFITLLFAFFVVLYSSSQIDKRKVGRLALAIQVAFQELGVFDTSNTRIPLSETEAVPFTQVQAVENSERTGDLSRVIQPMKGVLTPAPANAPLKDVESAIEKALAPEIQSRVVDVKLRKEGLIVSLREMGFYESGSATMRASSMGAIDRLAEVLGPRNEALRIEGHTDNIPIHNAHFPSNWELSTARATELAKLLIYRYKLEPMRLSAAGYAEFHPVDDNDTADGRSHNRRIDLVILNPALGDKAPFLLSPPSSPSNPSSGPNSNSKQAHSQH